jgi:K+-sensing histidine kinase KdpD
MQVLLNLVQNAARFTKHGFVCVRCAVVPAQDGVYSAKFAVLDSGTGDPNPNPNPNPNPDPDPNPDPNQA